MSRFDFLANRRSTIYENCVQAEQSSDISVQMLKIRQVMEYIVKRLLADNDCDDSRDLFSGINTLDDDDIFDEDISKLFHQTRIITNKNIHGEGSRSIYANDAETAMNNLVEIVIWYEYHHGDNRFEHSGFTARDLPAARQYLGSAIVTDELYIDVNVNPLQIMGSFDTADEPINILEQDVFETEAEYEARIASMEPVHIGYAILDSRQGDGYTNIHFLQHHFDRNRAVRFVQAPVYFFTAEMGADTVIDGELVARLVVHDHQVYLDYTRVFLRGDNEDIPISFICWDKIDYESDREYKARINALPILPLALCKPVRREYNIENQTLPFQVQPFVYVQTSIPTTLIVPCPRDLAKTVCQESQPLTIFGKIPQDNAPLEYSIWSKTLGVIYNNHEALEQVKREQEEKERKTKERKEKERIAREELARKERERRAKEEAERKVRKEQQRKDAIKQQYELGNQYWDIEEQGKTEKIKRYLLSAKNVEDKKFAIELYKKAIALGSAVAKKELLKIDKNINITYEERKNFESSKKQYELGNQYWESEEYEKAIKCYQFAADRGHESAKRKLKEVENPNVQLDIGYYFYQRNNYQEAVKWYRKAAEQGNAYAQDWLGYCYYNGQGVAQNYTEAVKWYKKSAEQGNANAQYALGICYQYGYGVTQNYDEAIKWYRKATAQGNVDARNELKKIIEKKERVEQLCKERDRKAKETERKKEEQQRKDAIEHQYRGGESYWCDRQYEKAIKCYRFAAEQGHADAQFCLGYCYEKGIGIAKDYTEAVKWYRKAAAQGNEKANAKIKTQSQIEQQQSSKSGCFITTAVCLASGKADDCYELTMFRRFRDGYLAMEDGGKALIDEYYRIAPAIVERIDAMADAKAIYHTVRDTYLVKCLRLIERGEYDACKLLYMKMVRELAERYLPR